MTKPLALFLLLAGTAAGPATGPSPLKLALSACNNPGFPDGTLCGTHEVFENRAARSGRKIPLQVAVIPANVPEKRPDAIVYFAGGPGESAVENGSWIAEVIRRQGPQTRDLLLVDLRGTGKSGSSSTTTCPPRRSAPAASG